MATEKPLPPPLKLLPNSLTIAAFPVETEALMSALPCTWTHAQNGVWDSERYDFGCHSGHWGGVSVLINKSQLQPDKIARVRLLWKEWFGGRYASETQIAATFLQEILDRFVPPLLLPKVEKAFYGTKSGFFVMQGGQIRYTFKEGDSHDLHKLDIFTDEVIPAYVFEKKNKKKETHPWANP